MPILHSQSRIFNWCQYCILKVVYLIGANIAFSKLYIFRADCSFVLLRHTGGATVLCRGIYDTRYNSRYEGTSLFIIYRADSGERLDPADQLVIILQLGVLFIF